MGAKRRGLARTPGIAAVTAGPPPSRYRVVEKDRRLVVIDTLTGEVAARGRDAVKQTTAAAPLGPERIAFDGRAVLVTRPFYDRKAPRRLVLDEGTTRRLELARSAGVALAVVTIVAIVFLPSIAFMLLVLAIALANGRTRDGARGAVTTWLDRFDTAD